MKAHPEYNATSFFSNDEIREEDVFWQNSVCHLSLWRVKVKGSKPVVLRNNKFKI
jgi:hypothetical protein